MTLLRIETPRVFKPLLKPSRYKGAWGGRGSGKSHFFAEALVEKALLEPGLRAVCVREVQKSLAQSSKLLIEDKIKKFDVSSYFGVYRDHVTTPGKGVILFNGMQDHTAASLKSLEGFRVFWWDEAQTASTMSMEYLRPTMRANGGELWFSWNPRNAADPVDQLLRGVTLPPGAIVVKANYNDNPHFPPGLEEERSFDERAKPDRYGHIWLGEYEPVAIGAIWDRLVLHRNRRAEVPAMRRILVSVDPAVSSNPGSDEHGIVVVGQGEDGRGYLLADYSMRGTPEQWARRALAAFDQFGADAVVIERNQGGDMCAQTLRTIRATVRIIEVTATRGKHVRAEPIAALYSLDRISHVGTFAKLEDQMCQMTAGGFEGDGSPDRVDALVWGFTELFPSINRGARKPVRETEAAGSWMG